MTHYGACAVSIASSACRERSEDPYRARGRASARRSISAVGEAPAPAPAPSTSAGSARRPSLQEAAAPWADGATPPDDRAAAEVPEGASDPEACDLEDCADGSLVRVRAPRAVVAAFDEAIDLYRAVEGSEATVTSFVEAFVAEASAGGPPA